MNEGLVGAEGFVVDASLIAADANKQRSIQAGKWKPDHLKEKAGQAVRRCITRVAKVRLAS